VPKAAQKLAVLKGHDFSRAVYAVKMTGAKQAAEKLNSPEGGKNRSLQNAPGTIRRTRVMIL
jgi:hypothetical protein